MKNLDWKYEGKLGDMWNDWSHAAKYAEEVPPVGSASADAAWESSDALWAEYQAEVADYEATMDAAANRGGY